jgi:hypothetical protein
LYRGKVVAVSSEARRHSEHLAEVFEVVVVPVRLAVGRDQRVERSVGSRRADAEGREQPHPVLLHRLQAFGGNHRIADW